MARSITALRSQGGRPNILTHKKVSAESQLILSERTDSIKRVRGNRRTRLS